MHRLDAFQQVVPSYFDHIPGDLVDAAGLPDHARGLRWKVVVIQGENRILVNAHGDVGIEVPAGGTRDLLRLDSDPDGLARQVGFSGINELHDALSDVLSAAIDAARREEFTESLSEAEAHAFADLMGPRDDLPDDLPQEAVDAGIRWIECLASQHRALSDADLDGVLDVIERFEMRGVDGTEALYARVAAIAAGANVSDDSAMRMIEWLGRRSPVEAQLAASTRDFVAGAGEPEATPPSVGRRFLERVNRALDAVTTRHETPRRKGAI